MRRGAVILAVLAAALIAVWLHLRLPEGASHRALVHDGIERSYVLFVPEKRASRPALVLALHGKGGSGASFERRTAGTFDRLAERDGAIVAYPDALYRQWNAGHRWEQNRSDDLEFLITLIDELSAEFGIDPARIYVTGLSNGASMAYRLACERPERIAAVAPVAGGLAQEIMPRCPAGKTRPVPLLLIHGTADPHSRFDDGELEGNLWQWTERNGCRRPPQAIYLPDADPADGTRTRIERYPGCEAEVVLYAVEGGGHHWPGGNEPWRWGNGPKIRDFDAGEEIWAFFERHPAR